MHITFRAHVQHLIDTKYYLLEICEGPSIGGYAIDFYNTLFIQTLFYYFYLTMCFY